MRLWIDFDNSPHVHFFVPLIAELKRNGVDVFLTVRSFGQIEELADSYGLHYTVVGEHRTPRFILTRVTATMLRALKLAAVARRARPDAAVSHGSRALTMAAWMLRIPSMTIYDYEFVSSKFFSGVSQRVLVPNAIPPDHLERQGVNIKKVVRYPGFKEEVYIYDVPQSPKVLAELGIDPTRLLITLRPPATWAHYHDAKSELLFQALNERLRQENGAQVIVLPRTRLQGEELKRQMDAPQFRVLDKAVDALSLMSYSDAVFSGGGTMIREAALLGVNAYSIFAGPTGAADEALERAGKLKILREPEQVRSLVFSKSHIATDRSSGSRRTRDFLLQQILDFLRANCDRPAVNDRPQ